MQLFILGCSNIFAQASSFLGICIFYNSDIDKYENCYENAIIYEYLPFFLFSHKNDIKR